MNTEINYLGDYRLKANIGRHSEPYWASHVVINGRSGTVVDAAGMDAGGRNVVRLIPYGERRTDLDGILQDGDLLAYVQGQMNLAIPEKLEGINFDTAKNLVGGWLKGRASHAELGYKSSEGHAMQVSLWGREGPMRPEDRRFFNHTDNDTISIYRVSLRDYDVNKETEDLLKAEVKRWKRIVQPVYFPCGEAMNVDPADFTSIDELKGIAQKFLAHSPSDPRPAFDFKLNCVQWSTMVFSLAVCFPLSKTMLGLIGAEADYAKNWAELLGYAQDGLVGLNELPIPFYTVSEIVENTLNMYLPDCKSELMTMLSKLPVERYISTLGKVDSLRVMPNAFVIENRLRALGFPRKNKTIFEYVGTAAPEWELVKEVSHE